MRTVANYPQVSYTLWKMGDLLGLNKCGYSCDQTSVHVAMDSAQHVTTG